MRAIKQQKARRPFVENKLRMFPDYGQPAAPVFPPIPLVPPDPGATV